MRVHDRRMHRQPPTHTSRAYRRGSAVGVTLALAVAAAACGTPTRPSAAWCDAVGDLDAAIGRIAGPDEAAVRQRFTELAEVGDRLAGAAPKRVRPAAHRVADAIDAAAETGEPTLFAPPVSTAMADVHAYAADECQYRSVSVEALDYSFAGMPTSLPSGRVAVAFDNQSANEQHELVVFVKAEGVEQPMTELLALPEEEAASLATPVGFVFAEPGQRNGLILDLEPGQYAAVCFVPVGGAEDGSPHFVHGMVTDFVVT